MLLTNDKEKIDYLIKAKENFLETYNTLKGFEAEKKRTKEFVDSFNNESKKQKSLWYAETTEHKSMFDKKPFILTHLCKKIYYGWWIFKSYELIKLHICVYESHTSFVENDYVIVNDDVKRNNKIFKYLPELEPILKVIPQVFFILSKEEIFNFDKEIAKIRKDISELTDNEHKKRRKRKRKCC